MTRKKFSVYGMTCSACSAHVEHDVKQLNGVKKVEVSLLSNSMVVEYDENIVLDSDILNIVSKGGYRAELYDRNKSFSDKKSKKGLKLILSVCSLLIIVYLANAKMLKLPLFWFLKNEEYSYTNGICQLVLLIPIIVFNFHYFKSGFKRLFKLSPNMDSLIAIGSLSSLFYGIYSLINIILNKQTEFQNDLYFESAGMILTIVSIGKLIESKSKTKATLAISKLLDLKPKMANLLKDGKLEEINIDELFVNDIVLVKPGELVPLDGIIIEGESEIDESMLTGEQNLVFKTVSSNVIGGTLNVNGAIYVKVLNNANDSTLQKIIDLVEEASNSKSKIAKVVDKISLVFVPIVILIAIFTLIIWLFFEHFSFALSRAISVLVISCPCALGLATPLAIMVGTYKAVDLGVLIRSGESFEKMNHIDTVVFDKTGTLTNSSLIVSDIINYETSKKELLTIIKSLEYNSNHPISKSILNFIDDSIEYVPCSNFEQLIGVGVKGKINEKYYYCCNDKMLKEEFFNETIGKDVLKLKNKENTIIYVYDETNILGLIGLKTELSSGAIKATQELKKLKINPIVMSGDNENATKSIATSLNINDVYYNLLPQDKAKEINKLKDSGKIVAMVGDGINDSVGLSTADVGISVGSGTDIAISSSDVVLMNQSLEVLVDFYNLSKKVFKIIKMNLFWAFFYNVLFITIATGSLYYLTGFVLNPAICAIAMSLSSISVCLNSLRIRNYKGINYEKNR